MRTTTNVFMQKKKKKLVTPYLSLCQMLQVVLVRTHKILFQEKIRRKNVDTPIYLKLCLSFQDVQILNSLTGCPVTEDELLYAIPVCAPYNALTNYK